MQSLELSRLLLLRNRTGRNRILGMALGVAVGISVLLLLLAAYFGIEERGERGNWFGVDSISSLEFDQYPPAELPAQLTAFTKHVEHFDKHDIITVQIAPGEQADFLPPGIDSSPAPGQFYASPALAELIFQYPADQLSDRFGDFAGLISPEGLTGPDTLIALVGANYDDLALNPSMYFSEGFHPSPAVTGIYPLLTILGAIAILIPVLLLVSIITGLGGKQRQERYAALRLIGASRSSIARIAALESALASTIGAILGVGLYFAIVPLASLVEVDQGSFYMRDLILHPALLLTAVALTVVLATATAWLKTWRADTGPLGATREKPEREPSYLGLLPLGLGLALLGFFTVHPSSFALLAGFTLVMAGPIFAGSFLTQRFSRWLARRSNSAAGVIAYNRIARQPRAAFRSVSGLTVALFAVTVFMLGLTSVTESQGWSQEEGHISGNTVLVPIAGLDGADLSHTAAEHPVIAELLHTEGAEHALIVFSDEEGLIVRRDDLEAIVPEAEGEAAEYLRIGWFFLEGFNPYSAEPLTLNPDSTEMIAQQVLLLTDGSQAGVNRVKTQMVQLLDTIGSAQTPADFLGLSELSQIGRMTVLANLGILVASAISLVSLAVSTISGILDRKRVLGLLRLAGVPLELLRRAISRETVVPLLSVFLIAVGSGAFTSWIIVDGLSSDRAISAPGWDFYLVLGAIILMAYAAVRFTSGSVQRSTNSEVTRYE